MPGSNNTAEPVGPFQQAMKVHHSLQTSKSSRGGQEKPLRPGSVRRQPGASQPTPEVQTAHESTVHQQLQPAQKSPEPCESTGCLKPRQSPDIVPLQTLAVAPGALPHTRIKNATATATDEKHDPAAAADSSIPPPPQRAPLRAAATRSKSPFSPPVRKAKDVGPFQASASLFQKKQKRSKTSKSRSQSSTQSHPSSHSREHRSVRGAPTAQHAGQQAPVAAQLPAPCHMADPAPPEVAPIATETVQGPAAVALEQLVPALPLQGTFQPPATSPSVSHLGYNML